MSNGLGTRRAIPAGDRKMPDPIVIPTTIATELQMPSLRGNRSTGGDVPTVGAEAGRGMGRAKPLLYANRRLRRLKLGIRRKNRRSTNRHSTLDTRQLKIQFSLLDRPVANWYYRDAVLPGLVTRDGALEAALQRLVSDP